MLERRLPCFVSEREGRRVVERVKRGKTGPRAGARRLNTGWRKTNIETFSGSRGVCCPKRL